MIGAIGYYWLWVITLFTYSKLLFFLIFYKQKDMKSWTGKAHLFISKKKRCESPISSQNDSKIGDMKYYPTFEDFYCSFSSDSHPSFSVSPSTGRMDRRKGEPTLMQINCAPNGASGTLTGDLVINLPEDNSKICYKVTVNSM